MKPIDYDNVPNPGSDEALKLGCKCPVLDNNHGRGHRGEPNSFICVADCPVHTPNPVQRLLNKRRKRLI